MATIYSQLLAITKAAKDGLDGISIVKTITYYCLGGADKKCPDLTKFDEEYKEVNKNYPYLWSYTYIEKSNGDKYTSEPVIIGTFSEDGVGVSDITEHYAVYLSNTIVPPDTYWDTTGTTVPSPTPDAPYLWNYETIKYTDGTEIPTTKRVIGVYGKTGNGISSITNYYLASSLSSGVLVDKTFDWKEEEVPTLTSTEPYLWNYEHIVYTDSTSKDSTPAIIGMFSQDGASPVDAILSSESVVLPCDSNDVIDGTKLAVSVSMVQVMDEKYNNLTLREDGNELEEGQFKYSINAFGIHNITTNGLGICGQKTSVMDNTTAYIEVNFTFKDFRGNTGKRKKTITITQVLDETVLDNIKAELTNTQNSIGLVVKKDSEGNVSDVVLAGVSVGAKAVGTDVDGYVKLKGDSIIMDGTVNISKLADIEKIWAREIVLNQEKFISDGDKEYPTQIRSYNYDRNGEIIDKEKSGFYLDSNGVAKIRKGIFSSVTFEDDGIIESTALTTVNKTSQSSINYTKSVPSTYFYNTDLINDMTSLIEANADNSAYSSTDFVMTYNGITYDHPRLFTSHSETTSLTAQITATGLSVSTSFSVSGDVKIRVNITSNGEQYAQNYEPAYTETVDKWVAPTYKYAWRTQYVGKETGTAPSSETQPALPAVGDSYYYYVQGGGTNANVYFIYKNTYEKVVATEGYWTTEEVHYEESYSDIRMILKGTTLTDSSGNSYNFGDWLSAGTYMVTQTWATSSGYDNYTGVYSWTSYPTYTVMKSYSQYYGLNKLYFLRASKTTEQWTKLTSEWTYTPVTITIGGVTKLQAGSSYTTWIGAEKRAQFAQVLSDYQGTHVVTGGWWSNSSSTVSSGILSITSSYVSYQNNYYFFDSYLTESEWLPSFKVTVLQESKGCYVSGGVFPKTNNESLGLSTREFSNVWTKNLNSDTGAIERLNVFGSTTPLTGTNAYSQSLYTYSISSSTDVTATGLPKDYYNVIGFYGSNTSMGVGEIAFNRSNAVYVRHLQLTDSGWTSWKRLWQNGEALTGWTVSTKDVLYTGTFTGATSGLSLKYDLTDYEFITITAWNQYYTGVYTFPSFMWTLWAKYDSRLVLSTDARYISVYFPSSLTLGVGDVSPQQDLVIYGIK